nr:ATP synthase F0 subunit 8 [Halipeurus diversus]
MYPMMWVLIFTIVLMAFLTIVIFTFYFVTPVFSTYVHKNFANNVSLFMYEIKI